MSDHNLRTDWGNLQEYSSKCCEIFRVLGYWGSAGCTLLKNKLNVMLYADPALLFHTSRRYLWEREKVTNKRERSCVLGRTERRRWRHRLVLITTVHSHPRCSGETGTGLASFSHCQIEGSLDSQGIIKGAQPPWLPFIPPPSMPELCATSPFTSSGRVYAPFQREWRIMTVLSIRV